MSEEPTTTLDEVLEYLTHTVLPISLDQRNYPVFHNSMRVLYGLSLTLTSIRCIERLFHDEILLNQIFEMATRPAEKKGFFESLFVDTSLRKKAIEEAEKLLTLWTDLTMVYQHEFTELWDTFKRLKASKSTAVILARDSGARPYANHNFDGLRLIMHNFDR